MISDKARERSKNLVKLIQQKRPTDLDRLQDLIMLLISFVKTKDGHYALANFRLVTSTLLALGVPTEQATIIIDGLEGRIAELGFSHAERAAEVTGEEPDYLRFSPIRISYQIHRGNCKFAWGVSDLGSAAEADTDATPKDMFRAFPHAFIMLEWYHKTHADDLDFGGIDIVSTKSMTWGILHDFDYIVPIDEAISLFPESIIKQEKLPELIQRAWDHFQRQPLGD